MLVDPLSLSDNKITMNNTTNNTIVLYELYSSMAEIIGYSLAYGILSSVAFVGNIMVFVVVFGDKSMRTTINILLVNLSLSDILYVVLSVPGFLAIEICNQRWLLGMAMAYISQGITILTAAASVFTLMAIAFERYFAIVHPLKNRTRNKSRTTFWVLVIIWLFSTAFALPFAVGTKLKVVPLHVKENGKVAVRELTFLDVDIDIEKFKVYYMILFVGLHVVPFSSLVVMYIRIAWQLWHPDKQLDEQPEAARARMCQRTRRRTTIMVIAVLVAFFVCFFPFHIYFITQLFQENYEHKPTTETAAMRVVLLLNAAVNPIIYNLLSEKFRTGFRNIFACCTRAKPQITVQPSVDTLQTQCVGN